MLACQRWVARWEATLTKRAPKALLWEMPLQAGHIVATGLKLLPDKAAPAAEQAWVLDRLMRFACSLGVT